ncbi:hypothetical protein D9M70_566090 [compost metagenome]
MLAVHQHRAVLLGVLQGSQDLQHVGVIDAIGVHRQADEIHRLLAEPGAVVVLDEADHGLHLQLAQQRHVGLVGQGAAVQGRRHPVEVERGIHRLRP